MGEIEKTLVCRRCNVRPKAILVDGHPNRIVCPSCGQEADFNEAVKAAGQVVSRDVIKDLQDSLVRSTRRSKHVKYVPGRVPATASPDFVFD